MSDVPKRSYSQSYTNPCLWHLCSASLAALNLTKGMPVLSTKLEQITLRELITIAKLTYRAFSLRRLCTR
jgi:hypothetical protein